MSNDIRTSPLDTRTKKNIEEIYVNLSMQVDKTRDAFQKLSYDKILDTLSKQKQRVTFVGEAGVGKTTLLLKIAYDWAMGRCLQHIELLIFVQLREITSAHCLEDIMKVYSSRRINMNTKKVEEYVKDNQRHVMLLLDGLDEYNLDISDDQSDAVMRIMKGDDFKETSVAVSTRPWRIEQMPEEQKRGFLSVFVRGFSKEDVKVYIKKFFGNNTSRAKSLIQLLAKKSLVAKNMAPYPIFCSMLCNMWTEPAKRDAIKTLETFSQLFEEMISSLIEHWLSKNSFRDYRKHCKKSMKEIGKIAFHGLLSDKLVFPASTFKDCIESKNTACGIGVLSSGTMLGQDEIEDEDQYAFFAFPHKLFQEYLSGVYLSSLFFEDPDEFQKLVQTKVLPDYQKCRYLIYFTLAHSKDQFQSGKALMKSVCDTVTDPEFIMDVAFECQEKAIISPAITFVDQLTEVRLWEDLQLVKTHTWSGYLYVLSLRGHEMVIA